MAKRTKRVVVIADMHCGHRAGLTPPRWRFRQSSDEHIWKKFTQAQEETWGFYAGFVKKLGRPDLLIVNGDCIDGRGERSGGVELITGDRNEQCKMAAECITLWKASTVVMTRGTPYHAGDIESWEDLIAQDIGCKIGDHEWVDVNGCVFDIKHHIGSSQIPHGRATAIARDDLWNIIWAEAKMQPRSDMLIRSHVHYYEWRGTYLTGRRREGVTTPALQSMGTRFGARRCSGIVNWGLLAFDVDAKGRIVCRHEMIPAVDATRATVIRV